MAEKKKKSMEGLAYGMKMELAKAKNDYIRSTVNGKYFLARVNMIGEQVSSGNIIEKIDDCPKTEEYMRAEYGLQKMQAIVEMRNAHFAKLKLKKDFKLTDEDILDLEKDYYSGNVIRDTYDETYKKGKEEAKFVDTPKD